ncbi:MAG: alpha/beta hydrolase, partial [Burkholderiales bacterium]
LRLAVKRMINKRWFLCLSCLMLFGSAFWPQALGAENQISVHVVATRPGVTVQVLVIKPEKPVATILLFPGGAGRVSFQPDGSTSYRGFPVRKPELFVQQGFMTAVINASSDVPARHFFRDTATHATDIRHAIAFLRKQANIPLWLLGHSAGSTSVANAAISLSDEGFAGIVLISSENGKPDLRSGYLDKLSIEEITVPTLIVHHEQDECEYTLFTNAQQLMARLKKASKSELISFKDGGPVSGDKCGSLHYHGLPGLEQEAASRIADWIKSARKQ